MKNKFDTLSLSFFLFLLLVTTVGVHAQKPSQPTSTPPDVLNKERRSERDNKSKPVPVYEHKIKDKRIRRAEAVKLLDRAPVLDPLPPDALSETEFIGATRALLDKDIKNAEDAVEALEKELQNKKRFSDLGVFARIVGPMLYPVLGPASSVGSVNAVVTSQPSSLSVRYYRSPKKKAFDTVTNNKKLPLDPPATWFFECNDKQGRVQKKRVSCAAGCSVHFDF